MASRVQIHKLSGSAWQQVKFLPPGLGWAVVRWSVVGTLLSSCQPRYCGTTSSSARTLLTSLEKRHHTHVAAGLLQGSNTSRCARAGAAAQGLQGRQNSLCLLLAGESPSLQSHSRTVCSQDPAKGASTAESRVAGGRLSRDARCIARPRELSEGGRD